MFRPPLLQPTGGTGMPNALEARSASGVVTVLMWLVNSVVFWMTAVSVFRAGQRVGLYVIVSESMSST